MPSETWSVSKSPISRVPMEARKLKRVGRDVLHRNLILGRGRGLDFRQAQVGVEAVAAPVETPQLRPEAQSRPRVRAVADADRVILCFARRGVNHDRHTAVDRFVAPDVHRHLVEVAAVAERELQVDEAIGARTARRARCARTWRRSSDRECPARSRRRRSSTSGRYRGLRWMSASRSSRRTQHLRALDRRRRCSPRRGPRRRAAVSRLRTSRAAALRPA